MVSFIVPLTITLFLEYCNIIYLGLPFKIIWKLHLVQNALAWPMLVLAFKALHDLAS